jgi:hypothetical protein
MLDSASFTMNIEKVTESIAAASSSVHWKPPRDPPLGTRFTAAASFRAAASFLASALLARGVPDAPVAVPLFLRGAGSGRDRSRLSAADRCSDRKAIARRGHALAQAPHPSHRFQSTCR